MGYHLITNMQPRALQCLEDLPEKTRAEFDYIDESDAYSPRFVQYRGEWYDTHDTQGIRVTRRPGDYVGWYVTCHPGEPFAHFDAIITDSYFSGIVFRFVGDDSCIVGRFYS